MSGSNLLRIPEWILEDLETLERLHPFTPILARFAKKYRRLIDSRIWGEEHQDNLLKRTLRALLNSDPRFTATYNPLALLGFFEQAQHHGRDHYFHSFTNFLLGCLVIDRCAGVFDRFRATCFPSAAGWSTEYVWLLTVFFHDVGYPVQKYEQIHEMVFGVSPTDGERLVAQRREAWDSPTYRVARSQMVSLYEHLAQGEILSDWRADPFPLAAHPLDRAFERSFLRSGHGVASGMRMLADLFRHIPESPPHRQFLVPHIFLAALSIPFHDWPVRECLRDEGISAISTGRFPFAGLLAFLDSIQEDRREHGQGPDILTRLSVRGTVVEAHMNLDQLPAEKLPAKRREAAEIKSFLIEDALQFQYPEGLAPIPSAR